MLTLVETLADTVRQTLLEVVVNSPKIRKQLTFREHLILYQAIRRLPSEKVIKLYTKLFEDVKPPKINPRVDRWISVGLYIACTAIPIPFLSDLVVYLKNKQNWPCRVKCQKEKSEEYKQLCYRKCEYETTKWVVGFIDKELKKCKKHEKLKKKLKCQKRLFKLLSNWKQRQTEAKIRWEYEKKATRARFKSKK